MSVLNALGELLWFPLLMRELAEKANRRRTYIIRVAYAVCFFGGFAAMNLGLLMTASDLSGLLGNGARIFSDAMLLQMIGVFVCLPPMMAGLITHEKERSALALLLLTDLRPWRIVLQKFGGGLVPMFSFLLMALPMSAIAYSLGGLSRGDVVAGSWLLLVLHALNVGALSLACSSYFRTSVGALIAAYVLGALWYSILAVIFSMPALFNKAGILLSGFMLVTTGLFLWLSTAMLERRAEARHQNSLLQAFRALDKFFHRVNKKLGGIRFVWVKEKDDPGRHPVCWREMSVSALSNYHYLIRLLLPIQTIVTLELLHEAWSIRGLPWQSEILELSLLALGLWILVLLVVGVQGSSLIASEKVNQTLDILLTTPLSGKEILLQKAMAFRRLFLLAAIPFATVFVGEWLLEDGSFHYIFCSIVTLAVYVPMFFWFSIAVGLHVKTRHRAVAITLGLLFLWVAAPLVFGKFWVDIFQSGVLAEAPIGYLSPASIILANEFNDFASFGFSGLGDPSRFMITLANTAIYGCAAFALRVFCTRNADTLLGRPVNAKGLNQSQAEKLRKFRRIEAASHVNKRAAPVRPATRRP